MTLFELLKNPEPEKSKKKIMIKYLGSHNAKSLESVSKGESPLHVEEPYFFDNWEEVATFIKSKGLNVTEEQKIQLESASKINPDFVISTGFCFEIHLIDELEI